MSQFLIEIDFFFLVDHALSLSKRIQQEDKSFKGDMMPKYFCQISRLLTIFFLWCSTSRKDQENLKENVEKLQNNMLS